MLLFVYFIYFSVTNRDDLCGEGEQFTDGTGYRSVHLNWIVATEEKER